MAAGGKLIRLLFYFWHGIAHSNSNPGLLQHPNIIFTITDCHNRFFGYVHVFLHCCNGRSLGNTIWLDFQPGRIDKIDCIGFGIQMSGKGFENPWKRRKAELVDISSLKVKRQIIR